MLQNINVLYKILEIATHIKKGRKNNFHYVYSYVITYLQYIKTNSDSEQNLKEEVGDVYTMLDLLVEWDVLSWTEIEERRNKGGGEVKKWSDLI